MYEDDNDDRPFRLMNYWNVMFQPKSYSNIIYLLLGFPTGLMYFLLLVIGISLGMSLLVILVGFPILLFTFILAMVGADFERGLANSLLGTDIPLRNNNFKNTSETLRDVGRSLFSFTTWKSLFFLGLKFPLGLMSFIVSITTVATLAGLIFAPFTAGITINGQTLDSPFASIIAMAFGLAIAPLGMHLLNLIAGVWKSIAESLLDGDDVPMDAREKFKREDHVRYVTVETIDDEYDPFYEADDEKVKHGAY